MEVKYGIRIKKVKIEVGKINEQRTVACILFSRYHYPGIECTVFCRPQISSVILLIKTNKERLSSPSARVCLAACSLAS
jgi:hypothetical protein